VGAGLCAGIHVLLDWLDRPRRARATAAELQLLLDAIGEGIYGTDAAGRCTLVNLAALRMLGYDSPQALLGASMHETIHHTRPDGSPYPAADCPMLAVLREPGSVTLGEEVVWRRDGTMLPIRYSAFPLTREGRWVAGAVVTFVDVTERRRLFDDGRRTGDENTLHVREAVADAMAQLAERHRNEDWRRERGPGG
jgi:PAS domain S-box-containing protein